MCLLVARLVRFANNPYNILNKTVLLISKHRWNERVNEDHSNGEGNLYSILSQGRKWQTWSMQFLSLARQWISNMLNNENVLKQEMRKEHTASFYVCKWFNFIALRLKVICFVITALVPWCYDVLTKPNDNI